MTPGQGSAGAGPAVDPIQAELFGNRLMSVAREMGEMLRRMALSTNVKERLDFSCGILDASGRLVVNAPHIPVHLGALGECVRSVEVRLGLGAGDVAVTNHPGWGGSHLPDVTVITPVFLDGRRLGYTASRAHHAELGGIRPGSMPPDARSLAEEGVVIAPVRLFAAGEARWEELEAILAGGPYPSRSVADNLADLRAQVAANRRGAQQLADLALRHGRERVELYMDELRARAARLLGAALVAFGERRVEAVERLDDGSPLAVTVEVAGGRAVIDFAGSAGLHPGNLNATPAITRSAVLYVLRLLVDRPLPLNEGLLEPVEVRIPPGILDPPFPDDPTRAPAVVGGNVETSQRLVDTLIKALGLSACGQGTMNNIIFGDERFGYYETVCGGAGATARRDGASAVHTHMTNTRITDPEILEQRYPVTLERFAVRRGSGGAGARRGGDGAIRELWFHRRMTLSVLTQHRVEAPFGMAGGEPGTRGRQTLIRASGEREVLSSIDGAQVEPGDRLLLETPGGGGWGRG
ncbi:MAG TPA: hydantoinase B/oxoprolinase family protein [Thermoanaerobaculia bacterium]|nr:hydantoinase B/oxoprolinase family protein [Thermoanaerobaculia bacterium]